MDNLAEQLKSDAGQIDVAISDDLERRIDASLQGVSPKPVSVAQTSPGRGGLWWASLTGATAAMLIIAFVNFSSRPDVVPNNDRLTSPVAERLDIPVIEWKAQSAMLTRPLKKELEDLQSDVRKAEQIVRREIGL